MRFCVLFLAALLLPSPTQANTPSDAPSQQPNPSTNSVTCALSVDAQLAAARKALQANDASMHAALACLITTTSDLNDKLHPRPTADGRPVMTHMRVTSEPVGVHTR